MKYFSFSLWVAILTLTGTYFRVREGRDIEALAIDWLVIAQVLVCVLGAAVAIPYLLRQKKWEFGIKALGMFIMIAIFSAFFNPYPIKVAGYWVLLAGASLLTMHLVYSAQTLNELKQIENAWLITITVLIFKDTIVGLFFAPDSIAGYNDLQRLGMGVTHANFLSFNAAIAFWLSFKNDEFRFPSLLWIPRAMFLLVILLARTRMSIFCLLLGAVIKLWYTLGFHKSFSGWYLRLAGLSVFVFLLFGFVLGILMDIPFFTLTLDSINRGQSAAMIFSATGRTSIWLIAIDKIFESFLSFIFGHGYGMSRFILNEGVITIDWYAYHAHNAYLEALLSMGFIGFCSFMGLVFYNLKWAINFNRLQAIYSFPFVLRAVIVVSMIMIYSITEAEMAVKIGPIFLIFIFYLIALDRKNVLRQGIEDKEFLDDYASED